MLVYALYPGSFDPMTSGHADIAVRASALFDQLVVGVFETPSKTLLFSVEERVELARQVLAPFKGVRVEPYSNLTINFARQLGARVIVRGLRMGSDFEREFDMALMNSKLAPDLETVCLMARGEHQFISSSLLKEAAQGGGQIESFVPECVAAALREKYCKGKV